MVPFSLLIFRLIYSCAPGLSMFPFFATNLFTVLLKFCVPCIVTAVAVVLSKLTGSSDQGLNYKTSTNFRKIFVSSSN